VTFNPAFGADVNNNPGNPQNGITATVFRDGTALTSTALGNDQLTITYLPWHASDLTQMTSAPTAGAASSLDGYATNFNRQEHINYIGADNHVHELWYDNAWHANDLTTAAGALNAAVGSALDGYPTEFNSQQHVNFLGTDGNVYELWFSDQWRINDLTRAANAVPPAPGTALVGYPTAFNDQQHVIFVGTDNRIHELFFSNGWHDNDLTGAAAAAAFPPAPGTALAGYATDFNHQQHVIYIGVDHHVHELFFDNAWKHNDLTNAALGAPSATVVNALDGYSTEFNQQQHVNYIVNGQIHELWFDSSWHDNNLTMASGAENSPTAAGTTIDGYSTEYNRQQHVNYIGIDNHVHELWFDNTWHHNDLSVQSAAPAPEGGTPLVGYPTSYSNQQHVIYIGADSDIHELWF
jgi:hypothetical protein